MAPILKYLNDNFIITNAIGGDLLGKSAATIMCVHIKGVLEEIAGAFSWGVLYKGNMKMGGALIHEDAGRED